MCGGDGLCLVLCTVYVKRMRLCVCVYGWDPRTPTTSFYINLQKIVCRTISIHGFVLQQKENAELKSVSSSVWMANQLERMWMWMRLSVNRTSARTRFCHFVLHMLNDMSQLKYEEWKKWATLESTKLANCTNSKFIWCHVMQNKTNNRLMDYTRCEYDMRIDSTDIVSAMPSIAFESCFHLI